MAKILPKEPIGEDLFESKSQEKIASSIIRQINKLHLIGIEGGWGTGKSNLVKIIENKINENEQGTNYSFYIYDAWGHQEDIHRRSLIEELVEYVNQNNLVQCGDEIEKKKDEIVGSVITTKVKVFSGFSWATFFILCALVSTPITSAFQCDNPYFQWKAIPFLSLLLILIAAIFAAYAAYDDKESNKELKERFKDELIGAYKNGDKSQEKTEYTNTCNPSTASIKAFFAVLSKEMSDNTVLFIVVDNLDRLTEGKVQDIWATIQTCFAGDNKLRNIKVIVPFDRSHLKRTLLKDENYLDDYLNKTFDVVFRVAPPFLSDWEDFFKKKWEEAFGQLEMFDDRLEFDFVKKIYDAYTKNITPRDIVSFINECSMIDMLEIKDIKFRYIAVFVKKKEVILNDIVEVLSNYSNFAPLEYLFSKDEMFPQSIAALAYQVPVEKGMELAIRRTLQQALIGKNREEVKRISEIKTFPSLLGEILDDIKEPEEISNCICALEKVEAEKFGDEETFYIRWNMLLNKVQQISRHDNNLLEEYQKVLLKKLKKTDKEKYIDTLLKGWYEEKQISALNLSQNIDAINEIASQDEVELWDKLEEYTVSWEQFEPFINKYKDDICKYHIKCDAHEVDTKLAAMPLAQLQEVEYVPALKLDEYKLVEYAKNLQELTKQQWTLPLYNVLIARLKEVKDCDISIEHLNSIVELSNLMQEAKKDNAFEDLIYDFLSIALVKFDYNNLQSQPAFSGYLAMDDMELAKKVADCIEFYMDYGDILLRAEAMKQSVLYQHVCQLLMTGDHERKQYLEMLQIVPKFEVIVDSIGIDKHDLAKYLSLWEVDEIGELSNDKVEKKITKSFLRFIDDIADNDFVKATRNRALNYLKELSQEEWKKYLQQGMESYGLFVGLRLHFEWTDSAMSALKEFFEETAKNKQTLGQHEQWNNLIVSLKNNGRSLKQTFGNVYDQLKDRQIDVDEFKFWADWIFEEDVIRPDVSTLRRFIPEKLLDDSSCVEIMLCHKEQIRNIYRAAGEEQSDFKNHLIHLIGTQSKNKKEDNKEPDKAMKNLGELAQTLGIDVSSALEQSDSDD